MGTALSVQTPFDGQLEPVCLALAAICGFMSIRTEMRDQVRFLTHHGLSWRVVWSTKTAIWFSFAGLFVGGFVLWFVLGERNHHLHYVEHADGPMRKFMAVVTLLLAAFFLGQLSALYSPTLMHCIGLTGVLVAAMVFWAGVVTKMEIKPLLGFGPLGLGAFLACLLRFPPWMNLRQDSRGRGPAIVVIGTAAFSCWLLPFLYFQGLVPAAPPRQTLVEQRALDEDLLLPGGTRRGRLHARSQTQTELSNRVVPSSDESAWVDPEYSSVSELADWSDAIMAVEGWTDRNRTIIPQVLKLTERVGEGPLLPRLALLANAEAWRLASVGQQHKAIDIARNVALLERDRHSEKTYWLIARLACMHYPAKPEVLEHARDAIRQLRATDCWETPDTKSWFGIPTRFGRFPWSSNPVDTQAATFFGGARIFGRLNSLQEVYQHNEAVGLRNALRNQDSGIAFLQRTQTQRRGLSDSLQNLERFMYFTGYRGQYFAEVEINRVLYARVAMAVMEMCETAGRTGAFPDRVSQVDPWTGTELRVLSNDLEVRLPSAAGPFVYPPCVWSLTQSVRPITGAKSEVAMAMERLEIPKPFLEAMRQETSDGK